MTQRIIVFALLAFGAVSCNYDKTDPGYTFMDDMYSSPAVRTYENVNGSTLTPVEGTVARGYVPYELENTNEGYEASKLDALVPDGFADMDPAEGKELYIMFCGHCHGDKGDGNGSLVQNEKFLGVPSYSDVRLPEITPGSIYHVIMHGKNNMGPHASQLTYEERWKVVRYVMQLRAEQSTPAA